MTQPYEIVKSGMVAAVNELQDATNAIDSTVNALEASCAQTLGTWVGDAQAQYKVAKLEWDGAIMDMRNLLDRSGTTLGDVYDGYTYTEYQNANEWAGFRV